MELIFWICLAVVAYTYFGYAILLWLQVQLRGRPILVRAIQPTVSIIIAVHNEEATLLTKLENLRLLEYPKELLQTVIVSDGSSDNTVKILRENATATQSVILDQSSGKACALNEAVKLATGEILVFMDARQYVALNALSELVSCFADSEIGAVSGELVLVGNSSMPSSDALGIYWRIEKAVRKLESASGSVIGVTGAIYAIRRELYSELPAGTILDDVLIPMHVARMGKRIVFRSSAIAYDQLFGTRGKEFSRKVRTLTGNYQLLQLAPWLLSRKNPLLFRFISHKLLRLTIPIFLIIMLLTCIMTRGIFFRLALTVQLLFYILAILGCFRPASKNIRPIAIANTFVVLNIAALVAFYNFITGNNNVWH